MGNYRTQSGDSGALVAYKGEGHHYSAGVQFAKNYGADQIGTAYPKGDVCKANESGNSRQ